MANRNYELASDLDYVKGLEKQLRLRLRLRLRLLLDALMIIRTCTTLEQVRKIVDQHLGEVE